eukprot:1159874-Prorocentrum_lima.AAC.1
MAHNHTTTLTTEPTTVHMALRMQQIPISTTHHDDTTTTNVGVPPSSTPEQLEQQGIHDASNTATKQHRN